MLFTGSLNVSCVLPVLVVVVVVVTARTAPATTSEQPIGAVCVCVVSVRC